MDTRSWLETWEQGRQAHPIDRALLLADHCGRVLPSGNTVQGAVLADVSLGELNRHLLKLGRQLFGGRVEALVDCAQCGERLELDLELDAIASSLQVAEVDGPFSGLAEVAGDVYRTPTSRDLAAISRAQTSGQAEDMLLRRLQQGTWTPDKQTDMAAVSEVLEALDPALDIAVTLTCEHCNEDVSVSFDVAEFAWAEVERQCSALLYDVHVLASSYGWSEADILAMPAARRAFYTGLLQHG